MRRQLPFILGGERKRPACGSPTERIEALLAQPPDMSETFLREVDENLRRDQLRDFFKKYGNWLIAAVVLFLVASGGFIWWKQHQVQRSAEQVEQLATIFKDIAGHGVTQGFDGAMVDFKSTNTFVSVTGCQQTRPRNVDTTCPDPLPACD